MIKFMKLQIVARTDLGRVRTLNEDNYLVVHNIGADEPKEIFGQFEQQKLGSLLIVADGMGGEASGEIASEIAKLSIAAYVQENFTDSDVQFSDIIKILENSLIFAHEQIVDYVRENSDSFGMGTTAIVALVFKEHVFVAWVGDSRMYRYSKNGRITSHNYFEGNVEILTNDHSLVWGEVLKGKMTPEDARVSKQSNIITQSLGDVFKMPNPDSHIYPIYENDTILLCSDGLNGMLKDSEINELFNKNDDIEQLSLQLINRANSNGGNDNITIALCKVISGARYSQSEGTTTAEVVKGNGSRRIHQVNEAKIERKKRRKIIPVIAFLALIAVVFLAFSLNNYFKEKEQLETSVVEKNKKDTVLEKNSSGYNNREKSNTVDSQNDKNQLKRNKVKTPTNKPKNKEEQIIPEIPTTDTLEHKNHNDRDSAFERITPMVSSTTSTVVQNEEEVKVENHQKSKHIEELKNILKRLPKKYDDENMEKRFEKIKNDIKKIDMRDTLKLKRIIDDLRVFERDLETK